MSATAAAVSPSGSSGTAAGATAATVAAGRPVAATLRAIALDAAAAVAVTDRTSAGPAASRAAVVAADVWLSRQRTTKLLGPSGEEAVVVVDGSAAETVATDAPLLAAEKRIAESWLVGENTTSTQ
jgi:hypothetical protein